MPQIAKGGKYIFGWSLVKADGRIQIPVEAQEEYHLAHSQNVILLSGSKTTGGFIVSTKDAIQRSKLIVILEDMPELAEYQIPAGDTIKYKGRLYSWVALEPGGVLELSNTTLAVFGVEHGDRLLSIRGSHMGIVMGVKGPIIEAARRHPEIIEF